MVTSVELLAAGAERPMQEAQIASSAGILQEVDLRVLYPGRMPWPQLIFAGGLLLLALAIFIFKGIGDDNALITGNLPPSKDATQAVATAIRSRPCPIQGNRRASSRKVDSCRASR